MSTPGALFVYGTLRCGSTHPKARLLAQHSDRVVPAYYQGQLYRISDYPGVIPSINVADQVRGEVFFFADSAAILPQLDAYEGCSPQDAYPQEYARIQTQVRDFAGVKHFAVWIYLYTYPVHPAQRIWSGDFFTPPSHRPPANGLMRA